MVGKVPKHCRRSDHSVNTQQCKIAKRCLRSNRTVNTQNNAPSGTVAAYNLNSRSDRTVNTRQRALSGTTTNSCGRSDPTVNNQHHAPSRTVAAYNLRSSGPDRTVNDQQHALSGTTTNRRCRSDRTVNGQHYGPSGRNTPELRHRIDHNIKSQQHSIPGPLALIGKTPKLHRSSDHTVEAQRQTLSGSLVMLGKTPKLQVELPLHLVVYEILTRLPVKTLSRFRCVSKPLRSFISHPDFQKLHARRPQQTPAFLIAKYDTRGIHCSTLTIHGEKLLNYCLLSKGPSQSPNSYDFHLVQSCLGLVCLRTYEYGDIRVFNPSTAEIFTLPERPDQYFDMRVGFGYTDLSDEFKVVRFFTRHLFGDFSLAEGEDLHNEVCFSEVFTLGSSHGWRETRSPPPFKPYATGRLPLVHRALHFLPDLRYHGHIRDDHYVSALDLTTEQFRRISLPEIYFACEDTYNIYHCQITELRGSLCMSFDFFESKKLLQLWFLKDYYGGKWVKECNINLSYEPELFAAFAVSDGDRVLLSIRSSKYEHKLCYYNAQKKCTAKTFGIKCSAMSYVESFLPLPLSGKQDDASTK